MFQPKQNRQSQMSVHTASSAPTKNTQGQTNKTIGFVKTEP